MSDFDEAVVVDLPLRGEWVAVNTPAKRIPSHGTDALGQRYAYDFVQTDKRPGIHMFKGSSIKYFTIGMPVRECYCWRKEVYSPFDGTVVQARDGFKEPGRLHPVVDILRVLGNALRFNALAMRTAPDKIDLQFLAGNYVVMKSGGVYALFAHLHPGSIMVKEGQALKRGEVIGRVGHTGNSTAPHLHFQLMDSGISMKARGIPCVFKAYETLEDGLWKPVAGVVPGFNMRFRR